MTESEQRTMADRVADRLLAIVQIAERLKGVETQVNRFSSDIESEKRTRAEATKLLAESNGTLDKRLAKVEQANWKSMGALAVLMVILQFAAPLILKTLTK